MDDPIAPLHLYRYRGYSTADLSDEARRSRLTLELSAALRGEVWFSQLGAQNDPFDTNPCYLRSPEWEVQRLVRRFHAQYGALSSFSGVDFREEASRRGISTKEIKSRNKKQTVAAAYHAAREMITNNSSNMIISCFATVESDILMWSYYSNSHSSFCFRFECEEASRLKARMKVGQVKYVSDRPAISTVDILSEIIRSHHDKADFIDPGAHDRFTDAFILTKSEHWRHEQEWRSLQAYGNPPGYYSIAPYRLTGVIFGCRAPQDLRDFVTEKIGCGIEFLRAKPDREKFALRIS